MNAHVRDYLVNDYENLIVSLSLPDPNDCHILAAAIKVSAAVIITYNLKDFPSKIIELYGIEAQHPNLFLSHLIELSPGVVCNAIRHLRSNLKSPPIKAIEYLDILEKQSLPRFANKLREFASLI